MGRTLALEHPDFHCVRIDLPPVPSPVEVSQVIAELEATDNEDQIAYREGDRYVARPDSPSSSA